MLVNMDRRQLLSDAIKLGGSAAFAGIVSRGLLADTSRDNAFGYGDLFPTTSLNTGETILMLPKGFQYTVFGRKGTIMSDGNVTPSQHDGMAAFASADGDIRIVRNHEVTGDHVSDSKCIVDASNPYAYDHTAPAGCSTIVIDPVTRLLKRDFVSLAGTHTNCAGGATPWGSWLSCEETVFGATIGKSTDGPFGGFAKEHGYVFEVPSQFDIAVKPVPLKALGRFVHEAIAIDPRTGILYLTEDRKTAGFYRFIPNNRRRLQEGGKLEMLMIDAKPGFDTRKGQRVGDALPCKWVAIDDPDPVSAATNDLAVYESGKAKGAATFARLEGAWFGNGSVYMSATSGGDASLGQVWRYIPSEMGGTLVLLFESRDKKVLWSPDNLTVSRRGGIAICEDTYGGNCHIRGLTPDGRIFDFAKNIYPGQEESEFAGVCYAPDGQTMFVNLQLPGVTCAIWGPWERGVL